MMNPTPNQKNTCSQYIRGQSSLYTNGRRICSTDGVTRNNNNGGNYGSNYRAAVHEQAWSHKKKFGATVQYWSTCTSSFSPAVIMLVLSHSHCSRLSGGSHLDHNGHSRPELGSSLEQQEMCRSPHRWQLSCMHRGKAATGHNRRY